MTSHENLFGKTLPELVSVTEKFSMPVYSARQIAEWLYKKEVTDIDQMTNISRANRDILKQHYTILLDPFTRVQESIDGTKKYLFPAGTGKFIEAAYIPEDTRATLCVSSQVGCKMGCLFCMTGKQGFQGNLSAAEIVNQVRSLPERNSLTNIVYMGMGEPFDNLAQVMNSLSILTSDWGYGMSPRRITVSTIGIIPGMKEFIDNSTCNLALSVHSPFDEERKKLMPVQVVYPIGDVIDYVKQFDWSRQRRISVEYIMFRGLNDTPAHVKQLARLLNGISCRVNLIRFHAIPGTPLETTRDEDIVAFRDNLNSKGIVATIRRSRGEDIYAACGLLSTKALLETKKK